MTSYYTVCYYEPYYDENGYYYEYYYCYNVPYTDYVWVSDYSHFNQSAMTVAGQLGPGQNVPATNQATEQVADQYESTIGADIPKLDIPPEDLADDAELSEMLEKIERAERIADAISVGGVVADVLTVPSGEGAAIVVIAQTIKNKAITDAMRRILTTAGRPALERARRSFQRRIDEHLVKIDQARAAAVTRALCSGKWKRFDARYRRLTRF